MNQSHRNSVLCLTNFRSRASSWTQKAWEWERLWQNSVHCLIAKKVQCKLQFLLIKWQNISDLGLIGNSNTLTISLLQLCLEQLNLFMMWMETCNKLKSKLWRDLMPMLFVVGLSNSNLKKEFILWNGRLTRIALIKTLRFSWAPVSISQ